MRIKTIISAGLLALSGAALAQVATAPEAKLGNGSITPAANGADPGNGADNANDPGKP